MNILWNGYSDKKKSSSVEEDAIKPDSPELLELGREVYAARNIKIKILRES